MSKKNSSKIDNILNHCCNLYGSSLSVSSRMKIKKFLAFPTPQNWDDICGIVVWNLPLVNIWTQLCNVNNTFCTIGRNYQLKENGEWEQIAEWKRTPNPMEVIIALRKLHEDDVSNNNEDKDGLYKFSVSTIERNKFKRK